MPGNPRCVLKITALVAAVQTGAVLLATRAYAAPTPTPTPTASDDPCDLLIGPAKQYCEKDNGGSSRSGGTPSLTDPTSTLDPLSSLAKGCAEAAAWTVNKLSEAVKETANVDFTNEKFLQQYAVVFAASTILTLLLWLLAVAKRAVRGVPLSTAISEAIGFLWLTVLASAFTPLILYTVVSATDGITDVLAKTTGDQTDTFFGTFSGALEKGEDIGGGPIMLIVVSLVSILAAGVLWLELVIRAALLYVGALLGTVVYAGLVDKNLWGHVRRWAGIMIAVILVKPVIVIVLGLAGALSADDGPNAFSAVVSGLAIILLAIFASAMIYRFVPGFGDELAGSRNNRIMRGAEGKAAAVISSPATLVAQGIKTHSSRADNQGGGQGGSGARPSNPASGGVAAHSSRSSNGGGGSVPSAAPAPRSSSPVNTPHASNTRNSNRSGGDGR
ncbi:membrane protein [Streptomyces viridochromogenes]|uniref:Membrane protein n=1 Tax=Streptomyces viridochromogenes TaxID=1938 RepID=A0A0J8BUN1_STRVR|nr:membrane protein [Streptomyces viridochromogenes]KMS69285.1 membrane protein [Streptomyces viridochromogenes]